MSRRLVLLIRCVTRRWFGRCACSDNVAIAEGPPIATAPHLKRSLLHKHPRGRPLRSNTRQPMQSRATCEISRARGLESKTVFGQNVQSVLSVIAPLPLISFIESPVGPSRFVLQSMLCARFPTTRSFTLRSSAHRPFPVLTPVAATATETSKPHHACSAKRADQVTYSRDQAHVGVSNHGKRSHNVSPFFAAVFHRRNAQNLRRGAAGAYWGGRSLGRSAAPRVRCRHEEQLSRQMLCSEGIGFEQFI